MSIETYSLSSDFGGTINTPNFLQEIDDSSITTALVGMRIDGDNVNITFASALSGGEQTTLDGLVSAHIAEKQEVLDEVEYEAGATGAPTVNDDSTANFEAGSIWVDTTNDEAYILTDPSAGSANWVSMTTTTASINTSTATATATTSTTSATYVVINTMTLTPASGTYWAIFSASGNTTANAADADYAIHVGGTIVSHSVRHVNYNAGNAFNNARIALHTIAEVSVNGAQAIDVRYQTDSGSFQIYERSLHIMRIGA